MASRVTPESALSTTKPTVKMKKGCLVQKIYNVEKSFLFHFKVKTKATNQECGSRIHGALSTIYKQSDLVQGKL